jgi:hypothetical protein
MPVNGVILGYIRKLQAATSPHVRQQPVPSGPDASVDHLLVYVVVVRCAVMVSWMKSIQKTAVDFEIKRELPLPYNNATNCRCL